MWRVRAWHSSRADGRIGTTGRARGASHGGAARQGAREIRSYEKRKATGASVYVIIATSAGAKLRLIRFCDRAEAVGTFAQNFPVGGSFAHASFPHGSRGARRCAGL